MLLLKFFRKSPFSRLFFFYAAGLTISYHIHISRGLFISLIALSGILTVFITLPVNAFRRLDMNWIFGCMLSMILFLSGLIHYNLEEIRQNHIVDQFSTQGYFLATVLETPEIRSNTIKANVRVTGQIENHEMNPNHFKAILYFEKDSLSASLISGSEVFIFAWFNPIPCAGNPGEFDYRQYLAARKVYLQAYISSERWRLTSENPIRQIKTIASGFRNKLLDQYRRLDLNQIEFGALSALTLGYRQDLDAQTKNSFTKAGVMHVMALSGFHMGVIALLLGFLLGIFNGALSGRVIRITVMVLSLWGFAIITGLSASVTRAAVMLSFVLIGKLLGKMVNTYNILFASAFAMLLVSPGSITDVSLQLTFSAVFGIVFLHPVLYRSVKINNYLLNKIWQLFTISCAAQLATFPVTIYYFHQFPVYFWLTNLYVIPLVSVIIYIACGYLLFSFIKPLAWIFGKFLVWTVKSLLYGVTMMERLPNALIEGIYIGIAQTVVLLFIVLLIGLYLSTRTNALFHAGLAGILILLVLGILHDCRLNRQRLLTINNLEGISALNLISKDRNLLLADPDSLITDENLDYSFKNFWIEQGVFKDVCIANPNDGKLFDSLDFPGLYVRPHFLGENVFIRFYDKNMVLLKNHDFSRIVLKTKFVADIVIVSSPVYPDLENLLRLFVFECLIIDSSVKYYDARSWIEACNQHGIEYWDVAAQGALFIQLEIRN